MRSLPGPMMLLLLAGCVTRADLPAGCYQPIPPGEVPAQLNGEWDVSLCIKNDEFDDWGHAWLRFRNVTTGEVRSIGRYFPTAGEWRSDDGKVIHSGVRTAGVWMGLEQQYEDEIAKGQYELLTVRVSNPRVFKGWGNGHGHRLLRSNCVTHARNAWHFYSGEWYELGMFHLPGGLAEAVFEKHPEAIKHTGPLRVQKQ